MTKLNLTPNEVVGYRIHPDTYNWTVVVVKRHGEDSKYAGQEYESPLAYCARLENAISWVFNYVAKAEGRKNQEAAFADTGEFASVEALLPAFKAAEQVALKAVRELEERLKEVGYNTSKLKRRDSVVDIMPESSDEPIED